MLLNKLTEFLAEEVVQEIARDKPPLTEIRIRAQKPVQLVRIGKDCFFGPPIETSQLRRMVLSMMEYSYYAHEEELAQGFFTLLDGCRVGVCGTYSDLGGKYTIRTIGSVCIRMAREIKGCAAELVSLASSSGGLKSTLLLAPPGLGKTTMLRDAARLLSEMGWRVGIADERHEIAACMNGVPTLDVGPRTDVADGLPKHIAMEHLIRSMSPHVIITDEIGKERDLFAVREAARRGVAVLTSAHALDIPELAEGTLGRLLRDTLFPNVVLLGEEPGKIIGRWQEGEAVRLWK